MNQPISPSSSDAEDSPTVVLEDSSSEVVEGGATLAPANFGTHLLPGQRDGNISVLVDRLQLWGKFSRLGTEMIINKVGR